jgi:hypothetical protein
MVHRKGQGGTANVHFPPIPNGVDYLVSVVDLLSREKGDPSPRDLKYAVLHLQAASEVLLKARLQIEHWTLTVKDANKTDKQKHEAGDFESPTHAETIRRLADVVGIDIGDDDKRALLSLARTRNALQHWGLTESAPAVETRAADVLDFLIRFLDDQLLAELDDAELTAIDGAMVHVRAGLNGIKAYVESRMDRLHSELKEVAGHTVQCPGCTQLALVVDGGENKCHFCPRTWDFDELAQAYASEVLNFSWHDLTEGGSDPRVECPDCETETLVLGAITVGNPDSTVDLCFNCAHIFTDLRECVRCGRLYVPDEEEAICGYCWRDMIDSE